MKQKVRIRWLKEGDSNSSFFHVVMCSRPSSNRIDKLIAENGDVLVSMPQSEQEVVKFYRDLFGKNASNLQVVDVIVVRKGSLLKEDHSG